VELKPHQTQALKELRDGRVLWGPTGSGKSRIAVAYYELEHRHQPVYVITTAKKRDTLDWEAEFARIGVGKASNGTVLGILTVDSFSNLHKYTEVSDCFFIFDEQRLTGSGKWAKSFLKIAKNNSWIMLTATPGDTWLDYATVFVANGFYPNRTAFKRDHVVYSPYTKFPKVDRYLNTSKLERLRRELLIRVVWENFTIRHTKTEFVDHNEELLQHVIKNRWHIYQNRPIRDVAELFGVMRKIVNNDPSRVRRILELYGQHPRMVIFYNFNYELEALKQLENDIEIAEFRPLSERIDFLGIVPSISKVKSK